MLVRIQNFRSTRKYRYSLYSASAASLYVGIQRSWRVCLFSCMHVYQAFVFEVIYSMIFVGEAVFIYMSCAQECMCLTVVICVGECVFVCLPCAYGCIHVIFM